VFQSRTLAQARADQATNERLRAQLEEAARPSTAWARQLAEERQLRQQAEVSE
jgi:3-methyladenine DNA glycosylase AlkC